MPRPPLRVQGGLDLVDIDVERREGELPALRHRVAGVHREVHEHLLELPRVDPDAPEVRGEADADGDRLAEEALEEAAHAADHAVQVEDHGRDDLLAGEGEELRKERDRLANAESLAGFAQQAIEVLDEGSQESAAASDLVGQAARALAGLAKIDTAQADLADQAAMLEDTLAELVRSLRDYVEEIEYNPKRLDEAEERLNLIHNLTRKYGGDIPAVIRFGEEARQQLDNISNAGERIAALESEEAGLLQTLSSQGQALSDRRKHAAEELGKGIEAELDDLKMAEARFGVDFQTKPDPSGIPLADGSRVAFDQTGFDRVEFLVAPNPGEGLKPLAKIASGGETSRLMLALKNILARADEIPSLIFDEIDQGIGGRVGLVVGFKLWHLARNHQVFCVTHLPQLAAFGDEHFQVQKLIHENRTLTRVERLDGEPQLLELSQMLGEVGEGTLRSAHELMQVARQMRREQRISGD